jgi:pyridoxamine 5'-phosphate oxidase
VIPVDAARADAYFAARPRQSQLGAWASRQSQPIASREALLEQVAEVDRKYAGAPVPRPPFWGGFLIVPDRIERWVQGDARLHHRTAWVREGTGWRSSILQP